MGDIKFRKNDIVVLESYDKNHKWICELKSVNDNKVYYFIGTYDVNSGNDNIMVDSFYEKYTHDTLRKATKEEKDLFNNLVNKVFGNIDNNEEVDDEQFYFVRRPDNMVEYSGNLPSGCNLEVIKQKHKIFKTKEEAEEYQKMVGIPSNREELIKIFKEDGLDITYGYSTENKVESTGYMQVGKTIAVIFNDANYEDEVELQLGDYEIEVRDGKTYAVKKKPAYPKTYEECCKALKISKRAQLSYTNPEVEHSNTYLSDEKYLLDAFMKLRICRNAYWKFAGEQMGLDKPWDSTYGCGEWGYCIGYSINENKIYLQNYRILVNYTLIFPTEEMRDVFYENFKDLIEQCKELL